jgi:RNA recognition motif-containing protein
MSSKLFVGGLSWGTTQEALAEYFSQVGTVVEAVVIMDKFSGRSKGFGFVTMSSPEEAQAAIEKLDGSEFDGRNIKVAEAMPPKPREDR